MPDGSEYRLQQDVESEFVEVDPTGRYGRYNDVLGKGASKTVYSSSCFQSLLFDFDYFLYRAFDEIDGIEVAWNQVKVKDVLQTPEDLERLYSEVHLLKTLKHKNIIKFYSSWVDTKTRNINFVTEMFTSGTLRQYRQKHKRVDIRAVKNWARQILRGLLYLHSHDPPIIHRDLKCDNIFVNGNQGEVKIGDLGLAAILRKSHAAHSIIGTPEFMAPELYDEEYNELVDIYAFGMCLLEMLTFEYPYSECSNPAQIYKKVTSGKKPAALYKVKDPEVRQFVEKCLATVSRRLPARELLMDPFLQSDSGYSFSRLGAYRDDMEELGPFVQEPHIKVSQNGDPKIQRNMQIAHACSENEFVGHYEAGKHYKVVPLPSCFNEDESAHNMDFTVKGKKRDDDTIFLRLRIADKEGHRALLTFAGRIRNIYFPFDVEGDTAMSVASEMVAELDITDQDVTKIADMIDEEILALVPDWKAGIAIEDSHTCPNHIHCTSRISENCCSSCNDHLSTISSDSSLLEYLRSHYLVDNRSETLPCSRVECAAMHGRFEEVTFQVDGVDFSYNVAEEANTISSQSSDVLHHDAYDWTNGVDPVSPRSLISHGLGVGNSDESQTCPIFSGISSKEVDAPNKTAEPIGNTGLVDDIHETRRHGLPEGFNILNPQLPSSFDTLSDEDEDSISRELRFLAIKHQQELNELQRQHGRALLEIRNRWRGKKALRSSPNRTQVSPAVNDQDWKMDPNGGQQHQGDNCCRHSRAGSDKLEHKDKEESVAKKQSISDVGRARTSGSSSPRSSPRDQMTGSGYFPVARPDNRNPASTRRLMKMHSFGDVDSDLYVNSLATEVGGLQHYQTIGAFNTGNLCIPNNCHGGIRRAPSIPRTSSPRN
eukprot:Gb_28196 [translate_table: standard]